MGWKLFPHNPTGHGVKHYCRYRKLLELYLGWIGVDVILIVCMVNSIAIWPDCHLIGLWTGADVYYWCAFLDLRQNKRCRESYGAMVDLSALKPFNDFKV